MTALQTSDAVTGAEHAMLAVSAYGPECTATYR
jgi:hypothetical protein